MAQELKFKNNSKKHSSFIKTFFSLKSCEPLRLMSILWQRKTAKIISLRASSAPMIQPKGYLLLQNSRKTSFVTFNN